MSNDWKTRHHARAVAETRGPAMAADRRAITLDAVQAVNDVRSAEEFVKPWVGDMPPQDSVEDTIRAALVKLGVEGADTMHPDALIHVLEATPKPGSMTAQDRARRTSYGSSAGRQDYDEMFLDANRFIKRGF